MIRRWLEHADEGQLPRLDTSRLVQALSGAWCWPRDEVGQRRAAQVLSSGQAARPPRPRVGEVCLVAVAPGRRASLWSLEEPRPGARTVRFIDAATESLRQAWIVASHELPVCGAPPPPRELPVARLLVRVGEGSDEVLNGRSFGLAFVLAAASRMLGAPVPDDVVATAEIDREGGAHPVDHVGLEEKLALIVSHAPGVRRVLIADRPVETGAPSQAVAAQRFLDRLGARDVAIVGVRDVRDALRTIFPASSEDGPDPWPTDHEAAAATREIIRATVFGAPGTFGWRGIAAAAGRLQRRFQDRDLPPSVRGLLPPRWGLEIACAIALRHDGRRALLPWPAEDRLIALARPIRLELVAHLVQAAADSDDDAGIAFAVRAQPHVGPPAERHAEDLKVLGAMGRAYAAAGRTDEAVRHLQEALDGWFGLDRATEASHAWCELVRVQALRGDQQAVSALLALLPEIVAGQPASDGYLHLAAGRALALVGRHRDALETHLGSTTLEWELTPDHVRRAALRWRALAEVAIGHADAARATRHMIEASCRGADGAAAEDDYLCLARLDDAVERTDDAGAEAQLAALRRLPHVGFESDRLERRLRAELGDGTSLLALARAFTRAYRY